MSVTAIISLAFILAISFLSWWLIIEVLRQGKRPHPPTPPTSSARIPLAPKPSPPFLETGVLVHAGRNTNRVNPKLLRLVNGDHKLAMRLVTHLQASNPNRSMEWCQEKAIYDLERDRL